MSLHYGQWLEQEEQEPDGCHVARHVFLATTLSQYIVPDVWWVNQRDSISKRICNLNGWTFSTCCSWCNALATLSQSLWQPCVRPEKLQSKDSLNFLFIRPKFHYKTEQQSPCFTGWSANSAFFAVFVKTPFLAGDKGTVSGPRFSRLLG